PVTVGYATANGTAIAGQDYTTTAGTLTFAPGTTTQQITVPVLGDTTFEADETFSLNLSNPVNATISDAQGIATITNDDPAPTLAVNDVTVTEGTGATTNAVFTVSLTGASALPATVSFTTADATAVAPGDYTPTSGVLTFGPGTTTQLITVPVIGDALSEPTETFTVNLSWPTNARLAAGQGIGTTLDNDGAPTISISDVTVSEGNAGTTSAAFTVSLTAASAQQITVGFATVDGTATGGVDYTATSGTLTFAPGTTAQQIVVPVQGDTTFEANETFQVTLTSPVNATIADGLGIGTITNDDPAPTLAINDVTVTEGDAGTTSAVFTVTLTGPTALPATVSFATADVTATASADYTANAGILTFAAGVTTQAITVPVLGDVIDETNETFTVNLSAATGAAIADGQGVGTILDNDPVPTLAVNDVTVTEGNPGTTNAVFTVTLPGATALPVSVSFATADVTATAGSDYTGRSGSLTFQPGTTAQQITVAVLGDVV